MNGDHRFTLLCILITGGFTVLGYAFKRHVDTQDKRWAEVNRLILAETANRAAQPAQNERMARCEAALVKLSELVAEQRLQWARHEDYHEWRDPPRPPLVGSPQNPG